MSPMPTASSKKVIDLDAIIGGDLAASQADIPTAKIKLFDHEFRVYQDVNTYLAIGLETGDAASIRQLIEGMIHEDDRDEWNKMLSAVRGLTPEILVKILNQMLEVASARPTTPPSASSPSSPSRARSKKSAGA